LSSEHTIGTPWQVPALQVSPVVHGLPSSHGPLRMAACAHPEAGAQLSVVHEFPSLHVRGLLAQVCWAVQCSSTVHWSVSAQSASVVQHAGIAVCWQPVALTQLSTVQAFRSSQPGAEPFTQVPPLHCS
jgi:hypothetical protein